MHVFWRTPDLAFEYKKIFSETIFSSLTELLQIQKMIDYIDYNWASLSLETSVFLRLRTKWADNPICTREI